MAALQEEVLDHFSTPIYKMCFSPFFGLTGIQLALTTSLLASVRIASYGLNPSLPIVRALNSDAKLGRHARSSYVGTGNGEKLGGETRGPEGTRLGPLS